MEWKGIELHNVRALEQNPETAGLLISRLPSTLEPHVLADAKTASGCELRLVPIDDEVRIRIRKVGTGCVNGIVFYGSVQSGWRELYKPIHTGECEITLKKSKNAARLKQLSQATDFPFSPEVIRVVLQSAHYELIDVIGACRPPRADELPPKTYLAYGSSITHGSLSLHPAECYPFRVAHALGMDQLNLGFAGRAYLEREMADFIAEDCRFDLATLEMGINLLSRIEQDELGRRVHYFVKRIAETHPHAKIFCTDIIYQASDLLPPANEEEKKINAFRGTVKRTLEELALPNTVYLPGLSLLCGAQYLTEDLSHPSILGQEVLAQNLTNAILKHLS